jgi:hypothetical protein
MSTTNYGCYFCKEVKILFLNSSFRKMEIKFIDLFCGIGGGFRSAMDQAVLKMI